MPLPTRHRWLALMGVFAGLLAGSAHAAAEEEVQVTVLAILASDQNKNIDPLLKDIALKVQKKDPKLLGFRLARTTAKSLVVGRPFKFPLVDKEEVPVLVVHGADKDNRVELKVKPPQLGEISYTTCCGKFFPIVTSYRTDKGERLIFAIMVEPCGK